MKQFKEIETRTIVNEDMKVETRIKTTLHTIRNWDELTTEEKEKEIEKRQEIIYQDYQEEIYNNFLDDLENVKEDFKNITFDTIYFESCSQGGWIDKIKDFKVYYNINILGETLEVSDIDLHIRRLIQNIDANDINVYDYYIESDKLEKIQNTKKYKKWLEDIEKEINSWINRINKLCGFILSREYYCPYSLEDPDDKEFLDRFFEEEEFEKVETIENIEV